ncbi:TetR/AcrR family transcriptional regulator [Adlercreutzia sp. ZJ154]|uniref:TetR/AcrR family transcriptional regulator n=1 Tax=Adlercreutzia sp. ZJ154 TaxID=2709790 RepID=UPI0013EA17B1|nr:TetR/AcrR family transcriptional regulator [Adlercreutzia sp. ZJ154]
MTIRSERSREAIKNSLLSLLGEKQLDDITMSELAAGASVSRSTLYSHYANTREIFDDAVADFCKGLRSLGTQLHCGECQPNADGYRPFCVAIRDAGKYDALVRDPSFLPTILDIMYSYNCPEEANNSDNAKFTAKAKRALFRFQMSGCYTVAMDKTLDSDWQQIQKLLDTYIRGGVNATRNF